ncbi:MAG: chalcone isomerase family protein [Sideroxydans sp.]|nr:chalcone isomerase family protein [Sideroxydans sp.]
MNKILWAVCGLLLSLNANARDVADVRVAEAAQVSGHSLQLNGAGTRTKVIIDVYVGALYLESRMTSAEAVLADKGVKRVALHMLYGMKSAKLLDAFKKGLEENHSAAELAALDGGMKKFFAIFDSVSGVSPDDTIFLDYLPAIGTKVIINGKERGVVEGADVNRALLKIWLGENPVEKSLKKDMLGLN